MSGSVVTPQGAFRLWKFAGFEIPSETDQTVSEYAE
jgi:hypothetical protein